MTRLAPDQMVEDLVKHLFEDVELEQTSNSQVTLYAGAKVGADDGTVVFESTVDQVLDITLSGLGGLDTGAEAGNTWYYVWLIWNPATETMGSVLSASNTAPTLPTGYTKQRIVGAVYNDGSSNFRYFSQSNKRVYYDASYTIWTTSGNFSQSLNIDISSYAPKGSRSCLLNAYGLAIPIGIAFFCNNEVQGQISNAQITPIPGPTASVAGQGSTWARADDDTQTVYLHRSGNRDSVYYFAGYEYSDL